MKSVRFIAMPLLIALLLAAFSAPAAVQATASTFAQSSYDATTNVAAQQDQPSDDSDDDRVEVMVYTVFAAALALSIGLVLFLIRLVMGWVKPPPPLQEEQH